MEENRGRVATEVVGAVVGIWKREKMKGFTGTEIVAVVDVEDGVTDAVHFDFIYTKKIAPLLAFFS